jgi:hypothetical protein
MQLQQACFVFPPNRSARKSSGSLITHHADFIYFQKPWSDSGRVFNIETDLLLMDRYFLFSTDFCAWVIEWADTLDLNHEERWVYLLIYGCPSISLFLPHKTQPLLTKTRF